MIEQLFSFRHGEETDQFEYTFRECRTKIKIGKYPANSIVHTININIVTGVMKCYYINRINLIDEGEDFDTFKVELKVI